MENAIFHVRPSHFRPIYKLTEFVNCVSTFLHCDTGTHTHNQIYLWERYRESSFNANANEEEKLIKKLDIYYLLDLWKIWNREAKFEIDLNLVESQMLCVIRSEIDYSRYCIIWRCEEGEWGVREGEGGIERSSRVLDFYMWWNINFYCQSTLFLFTWMAHSWIPKIFALTNQYQFKLCTNSAITQSLAHLLTHSFAHKLLKCINRFFYANKRKYILYIYWYKHQNCSLIFMF